MLQRVEHARSSDDGIKQFRAHGGDSRCESCSHGNRSTYHMTSRDQSAASKMRKPSDY